MALMEIQKEKLMAYLKEYTDYDVLVYQAELAFKEWSTADGDSVFKNLREIIDVAEIVLDIVEKFARDIDSLSSKDKLDAAVHILDDIIKLPRLVEWADQMAIKYVLSTIVNQKNSWFGKDWFIDKDDEPPVIAPNNEE